MLHPTPLVYDDDVSQSEKMKTMQSETNNVGLAVLLLLLLLLATVVRATDLPECPKINNDGDKVYDAIIVGGGAGGAPIASRLSEDPEHCILLLDAGPDNLIPGLHDPGNFGFLGNYDMVSAHDLKLWTTYQFGLNGRNIYQGTYYGLGGRTSINGGVATRASRNRLNTWPSPWTYDELLPYYKKSENHYCHWDPPSVTGISTEDCDLYHGDDGPMEINRNQPEYYVNSPWLEEGHPDSFQAACDDVGLGNSPDPSIPPIYNLTKIGCFPLPFYRARVNELNLTEDARDMRLNSTWVRESSASQYLTEAVKARSNLVIKTRARVVQILFSDDPDVDGDYKAKGVKYVRNGKTHKVKAKTAVVVAAGVFETPKLLQLSGIGDSTLLSARGISVLVNNTSVGKNYTDGMLLSYSYQTTVPWPGTNATTVAETRANNPFYFKAHNPLTYGAYLDTGLDPGLENITDMLFMLIEGGFATRGPLVQQYPGVIHPSVSTFNNPVATFLITLQFTSARGSLEIQSKHAQDDPQLDWGAHSLTLYEIDALTALVEGKIEQIVYNTSFGQRFFTGKRLFPESDNTSVVQHLADGAVAAYKQCCTCRMGSVVDPATLGVYGTKQLYIVDGSVFYSQVDSSHSMTIIAMSEKLSTMLDPLLD